MSKYIEIIGANKHNLKNISVKFPKDKLIVVTGVSGSGKSSLAFKTLYEEGQKRYLESLSNYARMFIGGSNNEADVDEIKGLSPTISIDQKTVSHNPRSTVGTLTEIYDFYRLIYLHLGTPHCPEHKIPLIKTTKHDIFRYIKKNIKEDIKYFICVKLNISFKDLDSFKKYILNSGFIRGMIDDNLVSLSTELKDLEKLKITKDTNFYIVVDRQIGKESINESLRKRITDSIDIAYKYKDSYEVSLYVLNKKEFIGFAENPICLECGHMPKKLTLSSFSFNSHEGMCLGCNGIGDKATFSETKIINYNLTLEEGAVLPWVNFSYYSNILLEISKKLKIPTNKVFKDLTKAQKDKILYGHSKKLKIVHSLKNGSKRTMDIKFDGIIKFLEQKYLEGKTDDWGLSKYIDMLECNICSGLRLNQDVLSITFKGINIGDLANKSVEQALIFFKDLDLTNNEAAIVKNVFKNILERLTFLYSVGLGYITIARKANTLSGGESQRIRLATQIGTKLEGIIYVLDEPSIGLHSRDTSKLISNLKKLVKIGNTVIVVEHDEEVMKSADWIIDIGPGAGIHGGEVVFSGTYEDMLKTDTDTALFLKKKKVIKLKKNSRLKNVKEYIELKGVNGNNLKNINVKFPLGVLTCVTGVSGSGKSTLINKNLSEILRYKIYGSEMKNAKIKSALGLNNIDKVVTIDQSPIGRTPRSNPATYTGLFTPIRELYSSLPESLKRGYKVGKFSFNTKDGQCQYCNGDGVKKIEMHFLPDVYIKCEQCLGTRYTNEVLDVFYKGKTIADVLAMSIEEAQIFFSAQPRINAILQTLNKVGVGYLKLGQSSVTLSGGEAQRIKLATELSKRSTGKTFYILDEPTTGLHFRDIDKLVNILDELVNKGNTVLVIEHNMDVISNADYYIDIGPEGGDSGGDIVFEGGRDDFLRCKESHTAKALKEYLSH